MAKRLPADVLQFFRKQGARGGRIGGKRSLETMTPDQRKARAEKASKAAAAARRARAANKSKKPARSGTASRKGPVA